MIAASDPDILVGELALGGLILVVLWRVFDWARKIPVPPDPWDKEVEKEIQEPDAVEICHRCFTPAPKNGWFCKQCGSAIGPYNNLMPYVQIFSEGEVFRNSTNRHLRNRPWIITGYFLIFGTMFPLFGLIYLLLVLVNRKRPGPGTETIPPDASR
ncbi:MAG TPA: hypothetical protein VFV23_12245 [Verrucomicrobiae bacterium]|nr:hypothetical protein [Verrucomicrobiae bacterium]